MKYNLIRSSATVVNLTEGNTDLTINELLALADNEGAPVTSLSGGSVLCLDTDLGSRLSLYELQYYFDSSADKATTAGDIEFFYKNESFEGYISLVTTYTGSGNLYNATTTSGLFAPRYIRMKHTVNASGTLYGYEILNNDDVVDFGTDGTLTSESVSVSRNYGVDIKEIPIYNDGSSLADAIILMEPQDTDVDYILSVSNSAEGPWYGPHTHELMAATDGTWNSGKFVSTTTVTLYDEEILIIAGENTTGEFAYKFSTQDGVYESVIFQNDSSRLNHVNVLIGNRDEGMRVSNDLTDTSDTIAIKSSSTMPEPYSTYLKLYGENVGNSVYVRVREYWQKTKVLISESSRKTGEYGYARLDNNKIYRDPNSGNYGGFYYIRSTAAYTYNSYLTLFSCLNNGSFYQVNVATNLNDISHTQYKSRMNSTYDQWFYFYSRVYDSGNEVDADGFYLMCYDKYMNKKFKYYRPGNFLADFDVVYNDRSVWIADTDGIQMKHFNYDGDVLGLYNEVGKTDNLSSVSVDNRDNSVWFSNGLDLHRINQYGIYLESIENVGTSIINQIEVALDDGDEMWVLENETIKRIMLQGDDPGRVLYSVNVTAAIRITPTVNGVWVDTTNETVNYISHSSRGVETIVTNTDNQDSFGYVTYNYDDYRYANIAPLSIDTVWSALEWQEVVLPSHTLNEDHYQQLRITLQKSTPYENYNVPIDEEWQVNDSFAQTVGTPMNDQRWSLTYDTEFTGTALRFKRYTGVDAHSDSYIRSSNRFYLRDDFDIRIKCDLVAGIVPVGTETVIMHLQVRSLEVPGAYVSCRLHLLRSGLVSYLDIVVNGVKGSDMYPTPLVSNELRLTRVGDTVGAYYKHTDSSWQGKTKTATDDDIGRRYYVQILMEHESYTDVDFYDFDASGFTNNNNIFNYCLGPQVTNIFTQQATQVYDIHPKTSKNAYLKTEIPTGLDLGSNYNSDLSVRWRTPVE